MSPIANDIVARPSPWLALTEFPRALIEWGAHTRPQPLLERAPEGDGHSVLVLPGFHASDNSTAPLRRFLTRLGYEAHEWQLGRNHGPKSIGAEGEKLLARLRAVHEQSGERVSLVGWSLGGIMARLLAQRAPEAVRQVITLGAPFSGDPRSNHVWRLYEWLSGQSVDDPEARRQLAECAAPSRIPTSAIYSRDDGIVAWQSCQAPMGRSSESIEVRGSHCGLVVNPTALFVIADRLAQPIDGWQPFERSPRRRWIDAD